VLVGIYGATLEGDSILGGCPEMNGFDTLGEALAWGAARLALRNMGDAPRELVEGTVHEWMRKRVGKVKITLEIVEGPLATAAETVLIRQAPKTCIVTGTNATTKLYKGRPQWTLAAEQAPAGVAQAYYNTIVNGCRYEGSASLPGDGLMFAGWAGYVLNVSDGASGWAAMRAPIHSAAWDIGERRVSVSFGPNPDLSPQDFMDYLRLLRDRRPAWISPEERISPKLGDEAGPSMKGDAIGPGVAPKETIILKDDTLPPFWAEIVLEEAEDPEAPGTPKWIVS
jgi:hypothetical protein